MTTEALLAFVHFSAILALVVFLSGEAVLCRSDWMNAAVVTRLVRLDMAYAVCAVAVLASGLARSYWGMKGAGWYWSQPLLHAKLGLFVVIGLMSIKPTLVFLSWRKALRAGGALPSAAQVRSVRRWLLAEAHLLAVLPLLAVFLARGG